MKTSIATAALILTMTTVIAQPVYANPLGDLWQRIESFWRKPAPQPLPEKTGKIVFDALSKTESAQFIRGLVAQSKYNDILKRDVRIKTLLSNEKDLDLKDQPLEYRSHVELGPSLAFLFGSDSGANDYVANEKVARVLTIGEHTTRVLEVYRDQRRFFGLGQLKLNPAIRNLDRLMKYTLAFHDIGKSFAAKAGDKSQETIYSCPIAVDLMAAAGFNRDEVRLSNALIWSHQIIGNFVRGLIAENTVTHESDPERAALLGIRAAAQHANMDTKTFYQLMKVVFTCDAGSYESLRSKVFTEDPQGKLIPIQDEQNEIDYLETVI